jgi:hypothetical protein
VKDHFAKVWAVRRPEAVGAGVKVLRTYSAKFSYKERSNMLCDRSEAPANHAATRQSEGKADGIGLLWSSVEYDTMILSYDLSLGGKTVTTEIA